ncbi:MAG: hypothetical protein LBC20_04665 [Planctomycetaceae bacterium]|jgi:hypothetical protein|nr:hypothetical protein [Planctomycetaceae bacterium]
MKKIIYLFALSLLLDTTTINAQTQTPDSTNPISTPSDSTSSDSASLVSVSSDSSTQLAVSRHPVVPAFAPSILELNQPFNEKDCEMFKSPTSLYYPETLMFFLGGNVDKDGITADLEAIADAKISGIQLFHGYTGGAWAGLKKQITCLSPQWENLILHTATECQRLGLKFSMHNSPGWAMSGGPWIKPENAMRRLVYSRTDTENFNEINPKNDNSKNNNSKNNNPENNNPENNPSTKNNPPTKIDEQKKLVLPIPQPHENWRDYKDIATLAFPTPQDDSRESLKPLSVKSNINFAWKEFLSGTNNHPCNLPPSPENNPHWLEITFQNPVTVRTVEFSSINGFNHAWCYEPGIKIEIHTTTHDNKKLELLKVNMPQANWQDDQPISFACPDTENGTTSYRISIANKHNMSLKSLRLLSAARKNNWEAEAGWTLRSIVRTNDSPKQSPKTFIQQNQIIDLSNQIDKQGNLTWKIPAGKWTILRIGHVNTGMKNGPAPPEATGWECDKLNSNGANTHFNSYIGRLTNTTLANGLLKGIHLDSWECKTQTWTQNMEENFQKHHNYPLRLWLPAIFGYIVNDHETSAKFLLDWKNVINNLFVNNYYGRMAELGRAKGLGVTFETAAGDIFPADILEYYKHADVPQTEFWQPISDSNVGSLNFKPIKPAASAMRLYGKTRLGAEALTSFQLTWDEHRNMLKEIINLNCIEGVTHLLFHTYTHNPRIDALPPGTSFGEARIGTPFLRGQTWWKYMPEFTNYLARLNYMLERGKPVSDILWYLGDEINHKPDQNTPFPKGYKYDYCNPDILLNRLSVHDGKIITPEGIAYRILWIPDNKRMTPETLEKLLTLVRNGAIVVSNPPEGLATLAGGENSQQRFNNTVKELWNITNNNKNNKTENKLNSTQIHTVGKGKVLSGMSIDNAIKSLNIPPDIIGDTMWLHRKTENADWYYVCSPVGRGFKGELSFNNSENAEIWNPINGEIYPANITKHDTGRTSIQFNLERAESCFVVFRKSIKSSPQQKQNKTESPHKIETLSNTWTLAFPSGWGVAEPIELKELKAWKDLDLPPETKAFSGTATYSTTFNIETLDKNANYSLDLGRVEMIAAITLNNKKLQTLWTPPYRIDITNTIKSGTNTLQINVTNTWFNRLAYDANLPENQRKTWTINRPPKNSKLKESGLLSPITLIKQ